MILRNAMFIQGTFSFEGCVFCALRFPGFTRAKKSRRFLRPRFDRDKKQRARRGTAISGASARFIRVSGPQFNRGTNLVLSRWVNLSDITILQVHLSLYFDNALPCL